MRSRSDEPSPRPGEASEEDRLFAELPAFDVIDGELVPRSAGFPFRRR